MLRVGAFEMKCCVVPWFHGTLEHRHVKVLKIYKIHEKSTLPGEDGAWSRPAERGRRNKKAQLLWLLSDAPSTRKYLGWMPWQLSNEHTSLGQLGLVRFGC